MRAAIVAAGFSIAACAALPTDRDTSALSEAPHACNEEGGETFISQPVTVELGAQILVSTEASSLRWVPPGMIVSMDQVSGRVSVHYDRDMRVTQVTCG